MSKTEIIERGALVIVPVALQDGFLVWAPMPQPKRYRGQPLIARFRALASADDAEILKFARQFGVLGIDEFGHPHTVPNYEGPNNRCDRVPHEFEDAPGMIPGIWAAEDLRYWRRFADAADAILSAAAQLRLGQTPDDSIFERFRYYAAPLSAPDPKKRGLKSWASKTRQSPLAAARGLLIGEVNQWLAVGDTAPVLALTGDGWRVGIGVSHTDDGMSPNLLGHLALDLLQAVIDGSFAWCSGCGSAFTTIRAPAPHRHSWCPTCVANGTKDRLLKRQQRARYGRAPKP